MSGECDIGGTLAGVSEIDRLSKLWIKAHDRIVQQDAEIERLTQSKNILSDLLYKMEAKANRHEALITELCDVLQKVRQSFDFIDQSTWDAYGVDDVLQQAREATR